MYLPKHLSTQADRTVIRKLWGYEELVVDNNRFCGKLLVYDGSGRSSLHRHMVKDEVLMVVQGIVKLEVWEGLEPTGLPETAILSEVRKDAVRLLPGVWHRLTPVGEATVYEWSTQHRDDDVQRWEDSCGL